MANRPVAVRTGRARARPVRTAVCSCRTGATRLLTTPFRCGRIAAARPAPQPAPTPQNSTWPRRRHEAAGLPDDGPRLPAVPAASGPQLPCGKTASEPHAAPTRSPAADTVPGRTGGDDREPAADRNVDRRAGHRTRRAHAALSRRRPAPPPAEPPAPGRQLPVREDCPGARTRWRTASPPPPATSTGTQSAEADETTLPRAAVARSPHAPGHRHRTTTLSPRRLLRRPHAAANRKPTTAWNINRYSERRSRRDRDPP